MKESQRCLVSSTNDSTADMMENGQCDRQDCRNEGKCDRSWCCRGRQGLEGPWKDLDDYTKNNGWLLKFCDLNKMKKTSILIL